MTSSEWLDPQGLADWLGIPVRTVYAWRAQSPPRGPRGHRIGRHVRYRMREIEIWIDTQADEPRAS